MARLINVEVIYAAVDKNAPYKSDPSYLFVKEFKENTLLGFKWKSAPDMSIIYLADSSRHVLDELELSLSSCELSEKYHHDNYLNSTSSDMYIKAAAYKSIYGHDSSIPAAANKVMDVTKKYIDPQKLQFIDNALEIRFKDTAINKASGIQVPTISAA